MTARWFETFLMVAAIAGLVRMGLTGLRAARAIQAPDGPPPSGRPDPARPSPLPVGDALSSGSGHLSRDRHAPPLVPGAGHVGAEVRPGPVGRRPSPRTSVPTISRFGATWSWL